MHENSAKIVTVSREELYNQVWSTPIRKLAGQYGLSDVGLAKVCKRFQIPRPPVGYWAKKEFGQDPPREALPICSDSSLNTIQFRINSAGTAETVDPDEPKYDADISELLQRVRAEPKIVVPEALKNPHPLIQSTRAALEEGSTDPHNLTRPRWVERNEPLCIHVSKACRRRALLFMDTLIKTIERFGGAVTTKKDRWKNQTAVTVLAEEIAIIRLRERYKQVPKQDIPKEPYYGGRNDFVPTGLLAFEIYDSYAYRPILQDTKTRRIEDSINSILIEWVHKAGRSRIGRRLAEEARKLREEQERIRRQKELELQRRRQELQARQKAEQDRVDGLLTQAESWKRSRDLRDYIEAVERFLINRDGAIEEGSEAQKWLTWARQQADRFDPLVPSPTSVLDERVE